MATTQDGHHFGRRHFQLHFLQWKRLNFKWNFIEICSLGFNWQYGSIVSDNGLAPNRRQAIIWSNVGMLYWHIYAPLGLTALINKINSNIVQCEEIDYHWSQNWATHLTSRDYFTFCFSKSSFHLSLERRPRLVLIFYSLFCFRQSDNPTMIIHTDMLDCDRDGKPLTVQESIFL